MLEIKSQHLTWVGPISSDLMTKMFYAYGMGLFDLNL